LLDELSPVEREVRVEAENACPVKDEIADEDVESETDQDSCKYCLHKDVLVKHCMVLEDDCQEGVEACGQESVEEDLGSPKMP
jgi:hypothetical protein